MKHAFKSHRILTSDGFMNGYLLVEDGRFTGVEQVAPPGVGVTDLGRAVLFPGLVDTHVHINDPGRTEWEGFQSATQAAAAGGVTTLADMPLNCIPVTTSVSALEKKKQALRGRLWVDTALHGGIIPGNRHELQPMIHAGVRSFKAFLIDSGIPEFPASDRTVLEEAMPILASENVPLLVHAEMTRQAPAAPKDMRSYRAFLASRPPEWENTAIDMMIELARDTRCRVHIVHLSSAEALGSIAAAKREGVPITAETCPHYLLLDAENIPDGDARFKCAPPIRDKANQDTLWRALFSGDIDFIVSDHSPCTPKLKNLESGNLWEAWGGISSLQYGLSLVWSRLRQFTPSPEPLARWMCTEPCRLIGVENDKGLIQPGRQADFVVWDPEREIDLKQEKNFTKHDLLPYRGTLHGLVKQTYLRGEKIYDRDEGFSPPKGTLL